MQNGEWMKAVRTNSNDRLYTASVISEATVAAEERDTKSANIHCV